MRAFNDSSRMTRVAWVKEYEHRLRRLRSELATTASRLRRRTLHRDLTETLRDLAAMRLPDGLYRLEFTAGQKRSDSRGVILDFFAEVVDGAGKGQVVGTTLSFASALGAAGAGNRLKIAAFQRALGGTVDFGDAQDHEEWLFRQFAADIVNGRIAVLYDASGKAHAVPVTAEPDEPVTWSKATGWDFLFADDYAVAV